MWKLDLRPNRKNLNIPRIFSYMGDMVMAYERLIQNAVPTTNFAVKAGYWKTFWINNYFRFQKIVVRVSSFRWLFPGFCSHGNSHGLLSLILNIISTKYRNPNNFSHKIQQRKPIINNHFRQKYSSIKETHLKCLKWSVGALNEA